MLNKCYDWWDSLELEEQYKVLLDWFPMGVKKDTDIEKFWGDLPEDTKWWIYEHENKCTEEDIEGQRDRANDIKVHEIMVEGREIE